MKKLIISALALLSGVALSAPAGAFSLHNRATMGDDDPSHDQCLAVAAGNQNRGANIITWKCDLTPSQDWVLGLGNPGLSVIQTRVSPNNWVLGPKGGFLERGTPIVDWNKTLEHNQDWIFIPEPNDPRNQLCYTILNQASQRYLTVRPRTPGNGTQVLLDDLGSDGQSTWCLY